MKRDHHTYIGSSAVALATASLVVATVSFRRAESIDFFSAL
ncbi:hypothetical protein [Rhizobium leguminosarum]|nr:hypothetical protein [Rhizobium leguminosarum]